jgi:hypothetical protein
MPRSPSVGLAILAHSACLRHPAGALNDPLSAGDTPHAEGTVECIMVTNYSDGHVSREVELSMGEYESRHRRVRMAQ